MKNNLGLIYAFAAYTWWGFIPIFWKQLSHVDSIEIVMHRMVWACVLVTLLIIVSRQWRQFKTLFAQPKLIFKLLIASVLVSSNWAVFIWAVNNEHLVQTSLGYFMNPLFSVALGVILFGEVLRRGQMLALSIAAMGVLYLVLSYGVVPWISLVLAVTFALYGAVKKSVSVPATHGLAVETMCLLIPAAVYLFYIELQGSGQFFDLPSNTWMLVLGGLFTLVPLVLFAAAAKRISMTALGMTQYIGPSLQLLIGVFIYNEPFGSQTMIAFGFIWLALAIYSMDQLRHQNVLRRARKAQKKVQPN
ncbi:MAG: chloramphenicol-sensitive protein RarD [Arenicella sp.]|jgi:chloramphenicol-sensitive protein RarD